MLISGLILFSCVPVLRKDLMDKGTYNISPSEIQENPIQYKGNLFIFGGIIVKTTVTKEGSLIEAIYVPVNSRGYLISLDAGNGRLLAIYRGKEILDPLIFKEKREITVAGEFIEMRKGLIDEAEYNYPLFEIKEIYLWPERKEYDYYYQPPYPSWYFWYGPYYDPWWDGPRWRRH